MLLEGKMNNTVKVGKEKIEVIFSLNFGILFILQKTNFGEERWGHVDISHCKLWYCRLHATCDFYVHWTKLFKTQLSQEKTPKNLSSKWEYIQVLNFFCFGYSVKLKSQKCLGLKIFRAHSSDKIIRWFLLKL